MSFIFPNKIFQWKFFYEKSKIAIMILLFIFVILIDLVESNPRYGKVTFINGSKQMVQVHLRPSLTWAHYESRTNQTLRSNPKRPIGFNRVPWVFRLCNIKYVHKFYLSLPGRTKNVIFIIRCCMKTDGVVFKWWQWWIWIQILWSWTRSFFKIMLIV